MSFYSVNWTTRSHKIVAFRQHTHTTNEYIWFYEVKLRFNFWLWFNYGNNFNSLLFVYTNSLLDFHLFVSKFFFAHSLTLFRYHASLFSSLAVFQLCVFALCISSKEPGYWNDINGFYWWICECRNSNGQFQCAKSSWCACERLMFFFLYFYYYAPVHSFAMQKIKKLEIIWRRTNLMTDYGHWSHLWFLLLLCVFFFFFKIVFLSYTNDTRNEKKTSLHRVLQFTWDLMLLSRIE